MNRLTKHALITSCALAAISGAAGGVSAAEPGAGGSGEASTVTEVVVTATRRETKLEKTPIAITAIGKAQIEEQRIISIGDVAQMTPGLVYYKPSAQQAYPSIRGTTRGGAGAGSDLGVTVFVDDVPTLGNLDDAPDLFDLQSIQVLKGPQGTLFGRNVTGGAIVIQSSPPSFTPGVKVEGTYGDHNLGEVRALVTGPIIDDVLAGKISGEYRRQDGLINAPYLHSKTLSTNLGGVRGQLLWTPNPNLKVLVGADLNVNASPYKVVTLYGNYQPSLFAATPLSYSPDTTNTAFPSKGDARTGGALARIDYTTPWGVATSITGFRDANQDATFSTLGDPKNQLIQHAVDRATQVTEELRFASPGDRKLTWVGGVFFLGAHRFNAGDSIINFYPGAIAALVPPFLPPNAPQIIHQDRTDVSAAAFADVDYAFTSQWKLSVGARFTDETRAGHAETTDFTKPGPYPNILSGPYHHSWSAFNPKVNLSFQATDDLLAYVSVASGFKSGGYDISGSTAKALANPYAPESVISYEAGVKFQGFDHRLTINADTYLADYKNLQLQTLVLIPPSVSYVSQTSNAGVANIPGFELELDLRPLRWLKLYGTYAYTGATFTKYLIPAAPPAAPTSDNGKQIPNEPADNYHVGAEASFHVPELGDGTVQIAGDISYASAFWLTAANNDPTFIHDRTAVNGLLNLHANWTSRDNVWQVAVWGKNVTGFRSLEQGSNLRAEFATPAEYGAAKIYNPVWTDPASVGVTVTFRH